MPTRFTPPITQLVNDDASDIASGWKLNFYDTGTTTRKDTFSDSALTSANANPVVADSAGRFGDIFLESGTYKVVLTDNADVEKWTADPVDGSIGSSGAVVAKTAAYTVTIDDATKIIAVDASSGAVTITLLAAATAGDGFEVSVKKTDSSTNAVTIDGNGSETIDGATTIALSQQYEIATLRGDASNWHVAARGLDLHSVNTFTKTQIWTKGADIASASPLVLGTDGNYFDVTGTTGFSAITVAAGTLFMLQFDGALTMTDGASLDLGGNNIITAAGDRGLFFATAANTVQMMAFQREGVEPLTTDTARISTGNYTGDGATSQGITGIGFAPKYVKIWSQTATTNGTTLTSYETTDDAVDDNASGFSVQHSAAGDTTWQTNQIISLDSDGFTVDDNGADTDPNTNTRVYKYLAVG